MTKLQNKELAISTHNYSTIYVIINTTFNIQKQTITTINKTATYSGKDVYTQYSRYLKVCGSTKNIELTKKE